MLFFKFIHNFSHWHVTKKINLLIINFWLFLLPWQANAITVVFQLSATEGGRIASFPGKAICEQSCTVQPSEHTLISLFALPKQGYRFQAWEGACAKTLGPLCTIKPDENAYAKAIFEVAEKPPKPIHTLLLLPDRKLTPTVWNEYVKEYFNNRCPVIYGGVILETDAVDSKTNAYCYRIGYGYYEMFHKSDSDKKGQQNDELPKQTQLVTDQQLSYEVNAALLGILNRHPQIQLTLVGLDDPVFVSKAWHQLKSITHATIPGFTLTKPFLVKHQLIQFATQAD